MCPPWPSQTRPATDLHGFLARQNPWEPGILQHQDPVPDLRRQRCHVIRLDTWSPIERYFHWIGLRENLQEINQPIDLVFMAQLVPTFRP